MHINRIAHVLCLVIIQVEAGILTNFIRQAVGSLSAASPDAVPVFSAVHGTSLMQVGKPVLTSVAQKTDMHISRVRRRGRVGKGGSEAIEGSEAIAGSENGTRSEWGTAPVVTEAFVERYAAELSLLSCLSLITVIAILFKRKENLSEKVFKSEDDADEKAGKRWSLNCNDLIREMGLSGMCFLDLSRDSALGKPLRYTLPTLAVQGFILQAIFLGYLLNSLHPTPPSGEPGSPLSAMIFASVYVHFVNVTQSLVFDFARIVHLNELHSGFWCRLTVGFICLIDAAVVPGCTLVVGSLFLCTSTTAADLICNSVGVAFITNIDNFIINIYVTSTQAVKAHQEAVVHFPVDASYVKLVNLFVCVFPIVPASFSFFMYHTGKHVMSL